MRRFISLVLTLTFLVVSLTGIALIVVKKPAAPRTEQSQSATYVAPKTQSAFPLKAAHEWGGFIFIAAGCWHAVLNRRSLSSYVGLSGKKEKLEKSA